MLSDKKITAICDELKIRDETKGTKTLDKLLSMKNNEGKTGTIINVYFLSLMVIIIVIIVSL